MNRISGGYLLRLSQVVKAAVVVVLLFQDAMKHTATAFSSESSSFSTLRRRVLLEVGLGQRCFFHTCRCNILAGGIQGGRMPSTMLNAFLPRFSLSSITKDSKEENSKEEKAEEDVDSKSSGTASDDAGSKLRRLKDLMWVRETLEDLTAAEFACKVESSDDEDGRRRRKRAVDYEKLLDKLNRRLFDMGCDVRKGGSHDDGAINEDDVESDATGSPEDSEATRDNELVYHLDPGTGMGSIVYSDAQRASLLERILRTRYMLFEVMKGNELDLDEDGNPGLSRDLPFSISLPELRVEIPKEQDEVSSGPKLYVRDDGTVDWDGALQDQAALRKFGSAVWARINGRDPESIEDDDGGNEAENLTQQRSGKQEVTAKIEETPQIVEARQQLDELKNTLRNAEAAHTALLASAIREGQAVANVRLAALEPEQRNKIRESAEGLELMREKVTYQTQVYELERVYTYLMREIGNPALKGYIPLQDRLNVAEFGLLESQIDNFNRQLLAGDIVDGDVLAVVMDQLNDFKRRLGIDYYVTGLSLDGDAIKRWMAELLDKTKKGLAFYVKGVQLFWNDIMFCLRLINRAAQGYTLKPREVRYIRRTSKDIVTFIPVVIILLIPLSPVGHVLVFGAIQRFFPGFFPSCFTEQRQNLLQLYETAEYSEFTINETFQEKVSRLTEAFLYFAANSSRTLYLWLLGLATQVGRKSDSSSDKN